MCGAGIASLHSMTAAGEQRWSMLVRQERRRHNNITVAQTGPVHLLLKKCRAQSNYADF
jgi:hypothetical protein